MTDRFFRTHYLKKGNVVPLQVLRRSESTLRFVGTGLIYGDLFGKDEIGYDAFDKDIARVQIYFKSLSNLRMHKSTSMTWTDFFSNIGGLFGLVLGMGIISLFEIIWLFLSF
jgi:hypothetical protein